MGSANRSAAEIVVAAPFLGSAERHALVLALRDARRAGIEVRLVHGNLRHAHLLVIDADTRFTRHVLRTARSGQVKLMFTSDPAPAANVIPVPKPVNLVHLEGVLTRLLIKMRLQLKLGQSRRDRDA